MSNLTQFDRYNQYQTRSYRTYPLHIKSRELDEDLAQDFLRPSQSTVMAAQHGQYHLKHEITLNAQLNTSPKYTLR